MRKKPLLVVLTVAAAIAMVAWVKVTAEPKAQPGAIAVVDVQRVFNACKEKADIEAQIQRSLEKIETDKQKRKEVLDRLQEDLKFIGNDKPDVLKMKELEIERKVIEIQIEERFSKSLVAREQMSRFANLYRKMRDKCGEVARANGFDAVMYKEKGKIGITKNFAQLLNQISARKLLWSSDGLDITDQVLQKLNNAWNAR